MANVNLTVSQDGSGDFASLQEAVDALPETGGTIQLKAGTYRERVEIRKPGVTILGSGADTTKLTAGYYARMMMPDGIKRGTFRSYTLLVFTHDFHAENICIENSAGPGREVGQAIAVYAEGDRISFRNCRILGAQDTLFTGPLPPREIEPGGFTGPTKEAPRIPGRQLYEHCYIAGEIDFIFGSATAYFSDCTLFAIDSGRFPDAFYCAPSTNQGEPYGYVFDHCRLTGDCPEKSAFLARPWRDYAKAVFLNCEMDKTVNPKGIDDWNKPQTHETAYYAQYRCFGAGAGTPDSRVSYMHFLSDNEARLYTKETVLGPDFF
ncbi:MAG: pectinesterase family protein [Lachnospiraceae bacterium]|jgi:pectinesterase